MPQTFNEQSINDD